MEFVNCIEAAKYNCDFIPKCMPEPTDAIPGSAEKIAILEQRVQRGEVLHHPKDRKNYENLKSAK